MTTTISVSPRKASAIAPEPSAATAGEILVPIDFSESSVKALHHAAALAASGHTRLALLNVLEEPASFRALDLAAQQRHSHHDRMRRLKQLARQELDLKAPVRLLVCDGQPSQQIRRVADEEHASLIVLGRHERHGLRRWLGGHTVDQVARQAPCPVLVLGDQAGAGCPAT